MKENEIIQRIQTLYPGAIIDIGGEDCNFELFVITDAFKGMSLLQRQKSLLALFKNDITAGDIHAMSITAKTPDEQAAQSGLVQIDLT
ncbi:MAG: BolA/IbaG family iron-sulfur metabolism protein [Thiotrichales bacterium]